MAISTIPAHELSETEFARVWTGDIAHASRRIRRILNGESGCGTKNCSICERQNRERQRVEFRRKGIENVLRQRLGDRMFESLKDKGYINLYPDY